MCFKHSNAVVKWCYAWLLLLCAHQVTGQSQYCEGQIFCLYGANDGKGSIWFTVHSSANGWTGIGIGSRMTGSDMYIGWRNSTNGYTISHRTGTGNTLPQPAAQQNAIVVNQHITPPPSWAKISFSFVRPITPTQGLAVTSSSPFIYAYSNTDGPTNPNDPNSAFPRHTDHGQIAKIDFTRAIGDTSGGSTNSTAGTSGASGQPIVDLGDRDYTVILKAHGAMMFIAWGVAPFFGIFIARYLKNALGHNWYRLHVFFMLGITGLFTLIGFIIIVLFAPPPHFRTTHAHRPIGLFMFIALFIQIALGFVANHMFDPNRPGVPWWDKAHWWLGRSLFVLGIINVYLGINLFSNYGDINMPLITGLYWAWVVIGFVALLAGNFKIGQKHHMAGNYAAPIDSVESL